MELIGYATGDDHLCLVYEYVKNGSLNDHLRNPELKGNISCVNVMYLMIKLL